MLLKTPTVSPTSHDKAFFARQSRWTAPVLQQYIMLCTIQAVHFEEDTSVECRS